jgi:DNA-directed RNA polymerase specialized sigma24 family protein
LTTFFIGQCLFRYPNVHRAHLLHRKREQVHLRSLPAARDDRDDLKQIEVADRRSVGTAERAIGTLTTIEELGKLDPKTRAIVVYRSLGYSWDEIVELTGLSIAAAKGRLHRIRHQQEGA